MKADKLIISHRGNLQAKYGRKAARVFSLIKRLKSGSKKQGLTSEVVYLDDEVVMKSLNAEIVLSNGNEQAFKTAIDQVYNACEPDYIVIIGAQDIIPYQTLKNPARRLDEEETVPSDLPYASEAGYSNDVKKYLSPTRVVGRIPDIPGGNDPAYLEQLISNILQWKPVRSSFYQKYFGLSTVSWKGSTTKNISKLFSHTRQLRFSPMDGPAFRKSILHANCHFINCHGALQDPAFYGEKGKKQPESLFSKSLDGRVPYGTIVAAECCYGAQLFDIQEAGDMSIANKYLREGAIAFLGSSNVAYGPEDNLALADLMTQYFLLNIFEGASSGRALLEARIKFLNDAGPYLDVMELKTYAQFMLLGDPSIHPVQAVQNTASSSDSGAWINTRKNRRENLRVKGASLQQAIIPPSHSDNNELPIELQPAIKQMLKDNHMNAQITKEVFVNSLPTSSGRQKSGTKDVRFIAYSEKQQKQRMTSRRILMIKEKGNQLLGSRLYVSR